MIRKNGATISTMSEWERVAGPKSPKHWKDHRSAKEAARAWLGSPASGLPSEIDQLFRHHPAFGHLQGWEAEPEARVRFDTFRGEPANLDLLLLGDDAQGTFVAGIEAKADESFGVSIASALATGLERVAESPNSMGIRRIEQLSASLLTSRVPGISRAATLRYQLLTASAAVLAEAERQGTRRAVLIVHEFVTPSTRPKKLERNADDLTRFAARMAGDPALIVRPGSLLGPFQVPGRPLLRGPGELYLGKAIRRIDSEA